MRVDKIMNGAFKFQQRLIYLHRLLKQRHDHQKNKNTYKGTKPKRETQKLTLNIGTTC